MTYQAACVLKALILGRQYGFEIMDLTGLPSGTVYPILRSFERNGWAISMWESDGSAREEGRPRRRTYRLTSTGRAALGAAEERLALHRELFPASSPLEGA